MIMNVKLWTCDIPAFRVCQCVYVCNRCLRLQVPSSDKSQILCILSIVSQASINLRIRQRDARGANDRQHMHGPEKNTHIHCEQLYVFMRISALYRNGYEQREIHSFVNIYVV